MAVCRSLALVFLLSVVVVVPSTLAAAAAVRSAAPVTDGLHKACNATSSPGLCLTVLGAIPESRRAAAAATPRRLGELAFRYLEREAPVLVAEARRETAATRNQSMIYCLREFNENIGLYARWLRGLAPERGAGGFAEARRRLEGILSAPSSSWISCSGSQFDEKPVIRRIFDYEAMMQVTLDLMNAAAGKPPPSSDYGADGTFAVMD